MSLQDLHARMLWDAASKGGSQADIARRYNEALQYLLGDRLSKMAAETGGSVLGMTPVGGNRLSGSGRALPMGGNYDSGGSRGPATGGNVTRNPSLGRQLYNANMGPLNPMRGWGLGRAIIDLFN